MLDAIGLRSRVRAGSIDNADSVEVRRGPASRIAPSRVAGSRLAGSRSRGTRWPERVGSGGAGLAARDVFTGQELQELGRRALEVGVPAVDDRQRASQTIVGVLALDRDRDQRPRLDLLRQ